jgi:NTP pyrophosphatase (non-canonical NTP hydrolase)
MTVYEYCLELLRLNQGRLNSFRDPWWFASVTAGLVEECLELFLKLESSTDNATDVVLECGDVLAYTVLVLASLRRDSATGLEALARDVANILEPYSEGRYDLSQHTSFVEIPLQTIGDVKRWFRERSLLQPLEVAQVFNASLTLLNIHLNSKMQLPSVNFAYVSSQNHAKLVGRVERQTLFVGSGDNR